MEGMTDGRVDHAGWHAVRNGRGPGRRIGPPSRSQARHAIIRRHWQWQWQWIGVGLLSLFCVALASSWQGSRPSDLPRLFERDYGHLDRVDQIPALLDASDFLDFRRSTSLLARILIPRPPDTPANAQVREALLAPFRNRPRWTIEEHVFTTETPEGAKRMTNLIVTYNIEAPRKLVLAAHHDSKVSPRGFVGATDSAVPCALLVDIGLALERALEQQTAKAAHPRAQETGLQLIFFDGEEAYHQWTQTDSVYGSRALADTWTKTFFRPSVKLAKRRTTPSYDSMRTIDSIDHFVLLDLLGTPHPRIPPFFQTTRWMWEELRQAERRLAHANALYPRDDRGRTALPPAGGAWPMVEQLQIGQDAKVVRSSFFVDSQMSGGIDDDHRPFLQNGVPILHLIPAPFPSVWHTMGDDASALDYPTIFAWSMIMRTFVVEYFGLDAAAVAAAAAATTHVGRNGDDLVSLDGKS